MSVVGCQKDTELGFGASRRVFEAPTTGTGVLATISKTGIFQGTGQQPWALGFNDFAMAHDNSVKVPSFEGVHRSLKSFLIFNGQPERPRHPGVVLGANGAAHQEAGPRRNFRPKIEEQIRHDKGPRRMVNEDVFLEARKALQTEDAKFVTPSRRGGRKRFGGKPDSFAEAVRCQIGNPGKRLAPVPGESIVPKHGVQQPPGLPQARDSGDFIRGERPGGMNDQFVRNQAYDGDGGSKISPQKSERVGQDPKIISQFVHVMQQQRRESSAILPKITELLPADLCIIQPV